MKLGRGDDKKVFASVRRCSWSSLRIADFYRFALFPRFHRNKSPLFLGNQTYSAAVFAAVFAIGVTAAVLSRAGLRC